MQIQELGEFALIDRMLELFGPADASVVVGAGDDTAAIRPTPGTVLLATCDSQVEDRHFLLGRIGAKQLGRRLAAVNLSDIAAMGGRPRWALASFVLPPTTDVAFLDELCRGLGAELHRFDARIVGGNLTGGAQLVLDLTLLGEAAPAAAVQRRGARPADAILVTGDLGAAAAGRALLDRGVSSSETAPTIERQLCPEPRVAAGQALVAAGPPHAMIDISDGLAQDLGHICDANRVGAVVEAGALPIAGATRAAADALGLDPLSLAVSGGEDYELLCCVPAPEAGRFIAAVVRASGVPLRRIGTVLPQEEGRWLQYPDGRRAPLGEGGWQHFGPRAGA